MLKLLRYLHRKIIHIYGRLVHKFKKIASNPHFLNNPAARHIPPRMQ